MLIILAAVTINLTVGENGIITRAERARGEMIRAQREEELRLSYIDTILGIVSIESPEDLVGIIQDILETLNINGLYRLDFIANQETKKVSIKLDCVRAEEKQLYREELEVSLSQSGQSIKLDEININKSKKVKVIDNEALLPIILVESLIKGEDPKDVVMISETLYQFKDEIYQLVMNMNESTMQVSIYFEKYINSRPKFKDVMVGMDYAIGLGTDGKLYYWDMEIDRGSLPVIMAKIKEIANLDDSSIDRIENGILVDEEKNIIYRLINPEKYNTLRFEKIELNKECKPKMFGNKFILSQDGRLWSYEGNCYNDEIAELNNIRFDNMNGDLYIDTNKNIWYIDFDEAVCLNNLEKSPLQGIKISKASFNYILCENGKVYEYNNHDELIEIEIDKNVIDIHETESKLIFETENDEVWVYDRNDDEIKKVDIEGNIKEVYEGYFLDDSGNLFRWGNNEEGIEIMRAFNNVENKTFIEVSASYGAAILIDEEYNIYEIGEFTIPQ